MQRFKKLLKSILFTLLAMVGAIALAMVLRIFFFASFAIPSASMEPTVLAGDQVLVYKMIPGPRVFTDWNFIKGGKVILSRLQGCRPLRRGEVAVFNFPYRNSWDKVEMDFNGYYIKRCVAVPGDTLRIVNGHYRIAGCNDMVSCYSDQFHLSKMVDGSLPPEIYNSFPYDSTFNWNIKNFGPLYIPCKGDILQLDIKQYRLYKRLIEFETGGILNEKNGRCSLDGTALETYTFQKNYYFMAGDKVLDSKDSRYWGLLPEDFIVGKALCTWWSRDKQSGYVRWNRVMSKIE